MMSQRRAIQHRFFFFFFLRVQTGDGDLEGIKLGMLVMEGL